MNERKTAGTVLLVIGAGAVYYGVDRMNSFVSRLYGAFGVTDTTAIAAIALGVVVALVGASLAIRSTN